LCKERNIKTAKSYTKDQLIDLLNGKELEKGFKCDFEGCNYSSNNITHLKNHTSIHTSIKSYKCSYDNCIFSSKQLSSLNRHIKIHKNEKSYRCDYTNCNYTCNQNSSLLSHKLIHSNTRNYKCNFMNCSYSSKTNRDLLKHKIIHTTSKPYYCNFTNCNYKTNQNSSLTVHKRIHNNERPYNCDFPNCQYTSNTSSHLTKHKKCMHTEEGQRRQKKSENFTFSYLEKYIEIKREHQVDFSCNGGTFCRLDGLSLHKNKKGQAFIIAHENDEDQHKGYIISCDTRRMTEVRSVFLQDGNDIPLVFIRYNPDAFRIDGDLQKIKKKDRLKRYVELVKELEESEEDMMLLTIYYMYYDLNGYKLKIFYDPDYPRKLKGNVKIIY
jgi:hypothetical protein